MFTSILQAIIAIPKILGYLKELAQWLDKMEFDKWSADLDQTIVDIKQAETPAATE